MDNRETQPASVLNKSLSRRKFISGALKLAAVVGLGKLLNHGGAASGPGEHKSYLPIAGNEFNPDSKDVLDVPEGWFTGSNFQDWGENGQNLVAKDLSAAGIPTEFKFSNQGTTAGVMDKLVIPMSTAQAGGANVIIEVREDLPELNITKGIAGKIIRIEGNQIKYYEVTFDTPGLFTEAQKGHQMIVQIKVASGSQASLYELKEGSQNGQIAYAALFRKKTDLLILGDSIPGGGGDVSGNGIKGEWQDTVLGWGRLVKPNGEGSAVVSIAAGTILDVAAKASEDAQTTEANEVIIACGNNDSKKTGPNGTCMVSPEAYRTSLFNCGQQLLEANPGRKVILVSPIRGWPNLPLYDPADVEQYVLITEEVANSLKTRFGDKRVGYVYLFDLDPVTDVQKLPDYLHPTKTGHQEIADRINAERERLRL